MNITTWRDRAVQCSEIMPKLQDVLKGRRIVNVRAGREDGSMEYDPWGSMGIEDVPAFIDMHFGTHNFVEVKEIGGGQIHLYVYKDHSDISFFAGVWLFTEPDETSSFKAKMHDIVSEWLDDEDWEPKLEPKLGETQKRVCKEWLASQVIKPVEIATPIEQCGRCQMYMDRGGRAALKLDYYEPMLETHKGFVHIVDSLNAELTVYTARLMEHHHSEVSA